jgi:hypothetical protein
VLRHFPFSTAKQNASVFSLDEEPYGDVAIVWEILPGKAPSEAEHRSIDRCEASLAWHATSMSLLSG